MITLSTLISAAILAYAGYQVIQWWDLHRSSKGIPRQPVTGLAALVGTEAEVVEAFERNGVTDPAVGRVRVGSELWKAELATDSGRLASVGEHVRVIGASGMVLKVECC